MNPLMMVLQQPLSVATLARCLGLGAGKPPPTWRRRPGRRHAAPTPLVPAPPAVVHGPLNLPEPEAPHTTDGCGWFDSSHELHQGLVVLEHTGAEGLGSQLPVTVWLELVLAVTADSETAAPLTPAQGIIAA